MRHHHRGSFLLLAIGLSMLIIALGFAFIRTATTRSVAAKDAEHLLLAQLAARAGLDHGLEVLLADYTRKTLSFRTSTGMRPVPNFTSLDGAWRSTFYALTNAGRRPEDPHDQNSYTPQAHPDNDIRMGQILMAPYFQYRYEDDARFYNGNGGPAFSMADGRGRFYELNYYNTAATALNTTPAADSQLLFDHVPVEGTRFMDPNAPLPARNTGIFLDGDFTRIDAEKAALLGVPGAGPADLRKLARYRLRYALQVEDLSGLLLCTPEADWDFKQIDPATKTAPLAGWRNRYRNPPDWVKSAQYAWCNLMNSAWTEVCYNLENGRNGRIGRTWADHVFLGRGWGNDVDVSDTAVGAVPATFPLMYRGINPNGMDTWMRFNTEPSSDQLYQINSGGNVIPPSRDGGKLIWWNRSSGNLSGQGWNPIYGYDHLFHSGIGPLISWGQAQTQVWSQASSTSPGAWIGALLTTPFGHPQRQPGGYPAYLPASKKWHEGRTNTPWMVNILTAPVAAIGSMARAYMPVNAWAYADGGSRVEFWKYASAGQPDFTTIDPKLHNPAEDVILTVAAAPKLPWYNQRDLFIKNVFPGFPFDPPKRAAGAPPDAPEEISPDWHITDTRVNTNRYPGPGWFDSTADLADTLGGQVRTSNITSQGINTCPCVCDGITNSRYAWIEGASGQTYDNLKNNGYPAGLLKTQLPAWWAAEEDRWDAVVKPSPPNPDATPPINNYWVRIIGNGNRLYRDSYWWDLQAALFTAVAYTRANWIQYSHAAFNPDTFLPGGANPAKFLTLREVDRHLLLCLGESIDAPGLKTPVDLAASPMPPVFQDPNYYGRTFYLANNPLPAGKPNAPHYIANNLRTLIDPNCDWDTTDALIPKVNIAGKDLTAVQRSRLMELVLNDLRMSFLGASPDYSDGLEWQQQGSHPNISFAPVWHAGDPLFEFRPLDFNGDGWVCCSSYDQHTFASGDSRFVNDDGGDTVAAARAENIPHPSDKSTAGIGPKPGSDRYFSLTGCFYLGQSHFFRIFSRGQLWDNYLQRPITEINMDNAVCIDPDGANPRKTHILYQRILFDRLAHSLTMLKD